MFQSRNVEGKSSSGSYRHFWLHTTDKAMMERKTRYEEVIRIACCRILNRWQYVYYWRRFRKPLVRDKKIKGTVRPEIEWWSVTRSIYKVFVQGRFDELEGRISTRKITEMQAIKELVIKNKKSRQFPADVTKGSFYDKCKQWPQFETFFGFRFIVSCKSRFAKDLARRINIINGKSIQFILLQRQKMERHMISLIQSTRCDNLWWHRCNIIWLQIKRIWQGQHHKDFSRYTNKVSHT